MAKRIQWRSDPVAFAEECLGLRLWHRQREILRAVAVHPRVAVRSGHKIGKSTTAAITALWFSVTRPRAQVVMTSSSGRQVSQILWRELTLRHQQARFPVGGKLNKRPDSGLQFGDGRQVVGFSTDKPERMAGISGTDLLFIVDEASGVPEEIFEAIEGNRAGGARLLMFGNPTQTVGEFHAAFHSKRDLYMSIHVSSEETPNVTGLGPAIPGLAQPDWIAEKRKEWGPDYNNHPLYQVRVKGEFPSAADNTVIPVALLDIATERWSQEAASSASGDLELGVDPARYGDDESVIVARRSNVVLGVWAFQKLNGPDLAKEVINIVDRFRHNGERARIKIDPIGVGASPYDSLCAAEYASKVDVAAVNVSEAATDGEHFPLLRDQLWFGLRTWLAEGGSLPDDPKLSAEISAIRYKIDPRNRQKVESKDELKTRLKRSPDRGDALCLAVFVVPPTPIRPPRPRSTRWGSGGRGF